MSGAVPTELHLDNGGLRAACDERPLDPERDLSSPGVAAMPVCRVCWVIAEALRRSRQKGWARQ